MTTPVLLTGWEHGANPVIAGGGIANAIAGTPTVQGTIHRTSGNYALRLYSSSAVVTTVTYTLLSPSVVVGTLYFYYAQWPSVDNEVVYVNNIAGAVLAIKIRASTHKLFARYWSALDGTEHPTTLSLNTWYRLDFKFDVSANPSLIDFAVDGVDATQAPYAQAATTINGIMLGGSNAGTGDLYIDDFIVSQTAGDYPIGPIGIEGHVPTSDGFHVPGTVMQTSGSVVLNGTTATAWNLVDDSPANVLTDYVKQTGTGTGNYAEVDFSPTSQATILGVQAVLAYHSASATTNSASTKIHRSDGADLLVYGGDMSESTLFYKSAYLSPPALGWQASSVNLLTGRMGYASDANPNPYWDALLLEVAYSDAVALPSNGSLSVTLANTSISATAGVTVKGASSSTLENTTISSAGTVASVVTRVGSLSKTLDDFTVASTGTASSQSTQGKLNRYVADMVSAIYQNPQALAKYTPTITGAVCYVAPNGLDTNPGTQSQPYATINKGWWATVGGGVCYVRDGVYKERPYCDRSGTSWTSMVNIMAYPGESPILDAGDLGLSIDTAFIIIAGSYTYFSGFEIRNSGGWGIKIAGDHSVVDNCYVHHIQNNGIFVSGDYGIAQNNKVYRTCLDNEYGTKTSWASACSAGRGITGSGVTNYAILRGNTVWENWGEGVSCYQASNITIEYNDTHDNFSANLYVSDANYVTIRQNKVYMLPESYMYSDPVGSHVGIMIGTELHLPDTTDINVIDNICYNNFRNYYWFLNTGKTGDHGVNINVANNTFVNAVNVPNGYSGVHISNGLTAHVGCTFQNNIVIQDDATPIIYQPSEITYSNNVYSKTPSIVGTNGYVGDPKLSRQGSPYEVDYYKPLLGSPAIGRASTLAYVTTDYSNYARDGSPDSGALEFLIPTTNNITGTVQTPTGINGTVSATLESVTNSSTATVLVKGSLNKTLDAATSGATATVQVKGNASLTLNNVGVTSTGKILVSGGASVTLGNVAISATGINTHYGSVGITLNNVTISATGTNLNRGAANQTLENVGISANGINTHYGVLNATLESFTISASGKAVVGGSLNQTVTTTIASAATIKVAGGVSKTLDDVTLISSGGGAFADIHGVLNITLDNAGIASTGTNLNHGSASLTLGAVAIASAGTNLIRGAANLTLGNTQIASAGTNLDHGALVKTLDAVTGSATGTHPVLGSAGITLDSVGISAAGAILVKATLTANLESVGYTLNGKAIVKGVSNNTLNDVSLYSVNGANLRNGALSVTLDNVTGVLTATNHFVNGLVAKVVDDVVSTSQGKVFVKGAVAKTTDNVVLSSTGGDPTKHGVLVATLDSVAISSSGGVKVTGSLSASLNGAAISSTASARVSGSLSAQTNNVTIDSTGKVIGTSGLSKTVDDVTAAISGKVQITGSAALVASVGVSSTGTISVSGVHHSNVEDVGAVITAGLVVIPVFIYLSVFLQMKHPLDVSINTNERMDAYVCTQFRSRVHFEG